MWKLAAILYLLIGPTLAGIAILVGLVVPSLGLDGMEGVTALGIGGLVAGVPVSFIAASVLGGGRKGGAA